MPDQDRDHGFGDPEPLEAAERRYTRGATDLIVSLASDGRTVRLFTADGENPAPSYYPAEQLPGALESGTDR